MARRETPQQAWERMRDGGGGQTRARNVPPAPIPPAPAPETTPHRETPDLERRPGWDAPAQARPEPPSGTSPSESGEASTGDLVKQLTDQTKTLVKQEMRLAQVELQEKGKKIGVGAGLFGAGGLVAFFGAATLIAAVVLGLSTALAPWLAALIVALVLLAVAGIAALMGKKKVEEAAPPAPEQAMGSVKRDVDTVKRRARK